jgi:membrane protease YdiL (CAAX protease family)
MTKSYSSEQLESSSQIDTSPDAVSIPPASDRPPPRLLHPRTLSFYGTLFGLGMIVLALLWADLIRGRSPRVWFPVDDWALDLVLGASIGLIFALVAYRLIALLPAMRRIERIILNTLDMRALTVPYIVWFGLIAGIPEEILFRGAIQPDTGLVVAAIIFGVLHAITRMYFVYATGAGILLGVLAEWSGGLWMPIAAHFVIDVVMFLLLLARWRRHTPVYTNI